MKTMFENMKKTWTIIGVFLLMCIVCLMLVACGEDVQPSVHSHSLGAYQYDSTYHWQICGSCGETQNKAAHSFDSWSVVTDATATSEGVKSHTCSICGYEETASIPKIQCTNHQYGEWIVTKQPTETQDGIKQRTCNICGHKETADVPMTGQTTYQISFNLNGGVSPSYIASKYVTELNKADFFFNVQKEGFNFRGWSYNGVKVFDESGNLVKSVELKPSMTFVALWANKAKLTIVTNMPEAGDISKGGEFEYNTEVDVFAHPHQGYEFVGWIYEDSVLSQQEEYNYKMWDKDVTITAKFKLANFKLSLNVNNSDKGLVLINPTGTIADIYEAKKESSIQYTKETTISAYTKTETRFLGWFDEDGVLVTTNAVYTFDMPNHDYALTARWNYFTVKYNLNGGTNNTQNPTSYDADMANIKLYSPTKSGVNFIGWQYNGQTITEINTKLGENLTLEAIWSNSSYKITYDYDGGSASNNSTYAVSSGYTLKNPTKSGCTFLGWTGSNGTTPQINVTIPAGTTGDKTYKANWKIAVYNISYSLSGGKNNANNPSTYTVNSGTIALHNPTRDYYTFKSWRYNGNTVTSISSSWLKDVTIEAVWEPISYSISYNLNGGSATNNTTYTVETATFTLSNPTKTGYKFLGWTGSNGGTPELTVTISTGTSGSLVYYANWSVNRYTITFIPNGGSNVDAITQDYGTMVTTPANPTLVGKSFVGWFDSTLTNQYEFTTMPAEDITLYAKWIEYDIIFETKTEFTCISIYEELTCANLKIKAVDTDGNDVITTVDILEGEKKVGESIVVRITAIGKYDKKKTKTISGLKIYGDPQIIYDSTIDFYNVETDLCAASFNATATDTYYNSIGIDVAIRESGYQPGDIVTILLQATDVSGNSVITEIKNIKVYGKPTICYNQGISNIKDTDEINADLFEALAYDSFNQELDITVSIDSGTKTAGHIITVKFSAIDEKGNQNEKFLNVKVYGTPIIDSISTTCFAVNDSIKVDSLGVIASDSFGENIQIDIVGLDEMIAGKTSNITLRGVDIVGNAVEKSFALKIYGVPQINYDETKIGIKKEDIISADLFGAIAIDSFNESLNVGAVCNKAILNSGEYVDITLTAVDCVGNITTVTLRNIGVYSADDIVISYNLISDKIKVTSTGEEFCSAAIDSFGKSIPTRIKPVSDTLCGGKIVSIIIYAEDCAGNTKESEVITGIKIYDVPEITYKKEALFVFENGESLYSLFFARDSFGEELEYDYTIKEGVKTAGETIIVEVESEDCLKNITKKEFEIVVISSNQSYILLYDPFDNLNCNYCVADLNSDFILPIPNSSTSFIGWYGYDGSKYTDEDGNSLKTITENGLKKLYANYTNWSRHYISIKSLQDFVNVFSSEEYLSSIINLECDIDLKGMEWVPYGTSSNPFCGQLNGNGHKIYNLAITNATNYAGLFGYTKNAVISNVGLEDVSISYRAENGTRQGALVAYAESTYIINCYSSGFINCSGSNGSYSVEAGGLIANTSNSIVENCFSSVELSINGYILYAGGLIGNVGLQSTVRNCFASGKVSVGSGASKHFGGLCAYSFGEIINCYRTENQQVVSTTSGSSYISTEGTVSSLKKICESCVSKWNKEIWETGSNELPNFCNDSPNHKIIISSKSDFCSLSGLTLVNKTIILNTDIDLSDVNYDPINLISCVFDGGGHIISNYKTVQNNKYTGIFGVVSNSTIKNIAITDVNIDITYRASSHLYFGALSAYCCDSIILNCYSTGYIYADNAYVSSGYGKANYCGGLIGRSDRSIVMDSYSTVNVIAKICNYGSATVYAGGIVGFATDGEIIQCFSTGDIKAYQSANLSGIVNGYYRDKNSTASLYAGNIVSNDTAIVCDCCSLKTATLIATNTNYSENRLQYDKIVEFVKNLWHEKFWDFSKEYPSLIISFFD